MNERWDIYVMQCNKELWRATHVNRCAIVVWPSALQCPKLNVFRDWWRKSASPLYRYRTYLKRCVPVQHRTVSYISTTRRRPSAKSPCHHVTGRLTDCQRSGPQLLPAAGRRVAEQSMNERNLNHWTTDDKQTHGNGPKLNADVVWPNDVIIACRLLTTPRLT